MFLSHESVSHRHNQPHCEYSSGKWRQEIEVRFCSQIEQNFRLESFLFSLRRRGSLAFRRKQSDEEVRKLFLTKSGCSENCQNLRMVKKYWENQVEELAREERLKALSNGKDTVFKISYQDKVTFYQQQHNHNNNQHHHQYH